jgi:hypothetical protein
VTVGDECGIVWSRHEPPGSCGSQSLMTTVEARACPAIVAGGGARRMAGRPRPSPPASSGQRRAVAVDGKTLRGATRDDGRQVHLLAAMEHATCAVLAQRPVHGTPGEVPGLVPLRPAWTWPARSSPPTRSTRTQRRRVPGHRQAGHYLLVVKANQPTLPARCAAIPWQGVPVATVPATAATAASSCAPSRWSRCKGPGSRTPPRSCRSPTPPASLAPAVADGGRLCDHQLPFELAARPPRRPGAGPLGDRGAAPPARHHLPPGTPTSSAPAPPQGPWPACATSPSASCAPASPQHRRRAATPATPPGSCQCLATPAHETAASPPRRGRSGCSSTTTSTHRGSLPRAMTSKLADRVTRVGKWP